MNKHVPLKVVFHIECLVTDVANEWSLSCVDSQMVLQEKLARKPLWTIVAGKLVLTDKIIT